MTHRPRITEESVLTRWLGMEIARINEGIVSERKTLASLLFDEKPASRTKAGGEYRFDPEILAALGDKLPGDIRQALKLPILFFFNPDIRDSCYLSDEAAVRALVVLGEIGEGRRLAEGRLWVSRAIAFAIARRYPTAIQFTMT
jgi:uncharacterized protein (UPF0216 family)